MGGRLGAPGLRCSASCLRRGPADRSRLLSYGALQTSLGFYFTAVSTIKLISLLPRACVSTLLNSAKCAGECVFGDAHIWRQIGDAVRFNISGESVIAELPHLLTTGCEAAWSECHLPVSVHGLLGFLTCPKSSKAEVLPPTLLQFPQTRGNDAKMALVFSGIFRLV